MLKMLAGNWWLLLVRGIAAILFGVLAFTMPGLTVSVLVLLFGIYALIDGVSAIITAFRTRGSMSNWWVGALEGVVGIIIGILVLLWPAITALVLLYMIAAWAILTGILEIAAAIQLRKEIEGEFWLVLAGVASIAFGLLAFVYPAAGALSLVIFIAAYAVVFGIALVLLAFRLRRLNEAVV